jgi:hypothetical protein
MDGFFYGFDGGVDSHALFLTDAEGLDVIIVTRMDPGVEGHTLDQEQWQRVINLIVHAPDAAAIVTDCAKLLVGPFDAELANKLRERIAEWEKNMAQE